MKGKKMPNVDPAEEHRRIIRTPEQQELYDLEDEARREMKPTWLWIMIIVGIVLFIALYYFSG